MTLFIQQIINGIALGSVYALTAIGYSMVYGVLELVNFAHGNVYMAGAFIYYLFAVSLGLPWWLSFLLTILVTGLFGVFYDAATLRPLRRAGLPKFTGLISSIGVSTVIYNLFFLFLGSETRMYPTFFEGQTWDQEKGGFKAIYHNAKSNVNWIFHTNHCGPTG